MVQYLLIVARDQSDLLDFWTRSLLGSRDIHVILDRRKEERRQRVRAHKPDLRRADRRRAAIVDEVGSSGFVIIRRQLETPSG